jgi:hypothetical protein
MSLDTAMTTRIREERLFQGRRRRRSRAHGERTGPPTHVRRDIDRRPFPFSGGHAYPHANARTVEPVLLWASRARQVDAVRENPHVSPVCFLRPRVARMGTHRDATPSRVPGRRSLSGARAATVDEYTTSRVADLDTLSSINAPGRCVIAWLMAGDSGAEPLCGAFQ